MISGSSTSLRPSGIGRYVTAAFFSVWLVGWAIGEAVAISMLATMFGSIAKGFSGGLPAWSADLAASSGAAFVVFFLLGWLALWTVGGFAAFLHLMQSLAGEDVITLNASGFEVVSRAGPFRRRYAFDRAGIRRLRVRSHDKAVVADTAKGTRVITRFGLPAERDDVTGWLSQHLGLSRADAATATPPATWDERVEGEVTYLRKVRPGARLTRSIIAWLLTAAIASTWYASLDADTSASHIPALILTLLLAMGAAASTWGRRELIVRPGELVFRRSFALWTAERVFSGARLEVMNETDSDNDHHYKLIVSDTAGRRRIHSQVHDSDEVVVLAQWLAARTGFPLKA